MSKARQKGWRLIADAWAEGRRDQARADLATALAEAPADPELRALQLKFAFETGETVDLEAAAEDVWVLAFADLMEWSEIDAAAATLPAMLERFRKRSYFRTAGRLLALMPEQRDGFVDDPKASFQIVPRPGADTVVFAFTGGTQRLGMPVSIMHQLLASRGLHACYLKDFSRQIYRNGIVGVADTREGAIRALKAIAHELGARRIVCMGTSMGGYAAISYGLDLSAAAVLSFCPVTSFRLETLQERALKRAAAELGRPLTQADLDPFDLRRLYAGKNHFPRTRIVYSAAAKGDGAEAEHMAGLPGVTLEGLPGPPAHQILRHVLKLGLLGDTLDWLARGGDPIRGEEAAGTR